ncbi:MAG TPA: site-specific tyrosine recombinase/integron integrase [Patescibacteria group bacterium]|nr:site-specific tyrosine recombinase/integron integrase [Patescibacteria group bacterium]
MKNLREQMKMDLELKGFSPNTQKLYIAHVKRFAEHFMKSPLDLGESEIKEYLHFLITERNLSNSYVSGTYSALKFLFETTLKRQWEMEGIPRTKRQKKLPIILSKDEVKRLFNVTTNLKHRTILATIYSAGLRVSEAANLKLKDIDSSNMQIRVEQGKGSKDRYTILSDKNLELLRQYYKLHRPTTWLFPGQSIEEPVTSRTIQRVFEISKQKAGINKDVTVHSLRHSFATHLLEAGTDIFHIQLLLGHSSVKTTSIYIHLTSKNLMNLKSPLDTIVG